MWMGFLYAVVVSELLGPGKTKVSKKGMDPSVLCISIVNCTGGSMELMFCRK